MIPTPTAEPTSVERSDHLLQPTFEMLADFQPELLGRHGFPDLDEEVTTFSPERAAERIAAHESELRRLERLRRAETDPEVHFDLEIASHGLTLEHEKLRFDAEHSLPYLDPLSVVVQGLEALLLIPVEPHRRRAALTRLRRYAGLETGYTPLTLQARALLRSRLAEHGRLAPCTQKVEADLGRTERVLDAIEQLFHLHQLSGHEPVLRVLRRQLADHQAFLERELLPKTRSDFRLPTEPLEIVVPLPPATAGAGEEHGDHAFEAASWWLAAHEGWPGHGLHFSQLYAHRLSRARKFLGYNTAMVEGWALYAEAEIRAQLPLTAQLVILRQHLLRCARAWLDLGLQQGAVERAEACGWLCEKVGVSPAKARLELERATLLRPLAGAAYFAGYQRLSELRAETERVLGPAFEPRRYQERLLARGLGPQARLRPSLWHTLEPCHAAAA